MVEVATPGGRYESGGVAKAKSDKKLGVDLKKPKGWPS
jgi:hypothetical protein